MGKLLAVKENNVLSFEEFWEEYPRKVSKKAAFKAFSKIEMNQELAEKIMMALHKQKKQWDDPKYIPHAATWLNGERWEDEVEEVGTWVKEWAR